MTVAGEEQAVVTDALDAVTTAMRALGVARRRLEALPVPGQAMLPLSGDDGRGGVAQLGQGARLDGDGGVAHHPEF